MLGIKLCLGLGLRLGLGMQYTAGMCVTAGVLFDFIHNPARIIGMRKVTFRVPMGCLGMGQIVGMLRVGNENVLR